MIIPIELAQAIAANARNKGLRTDKTTHAHECLKLREELCEAERALLDGDDEGHAREIADVAIYLIGYAWEQGIELKGATLIGHKYDNIERLREWVRVIEVAELASDLLACFFEAIWEYAKRHGIDLLEAIRAKHAYNLTRPYGHKEEQRALADECLRRITDWLADGNVCFFCGFNDDETAHEEHCPLHVGESP